MICLCLMCIMAQLEGKLKLIISFPPDLALYIVPIVLTVFDVVRSSIDCGVLWRCI